MIFGDGDLREAIKGQIDSLGLSDRCRLAGFRKDFDQFLAMPRSFCAIVVHGRIAERALGIGGGGMFPSLLLMWVAQRKSWKMASPGTLYLPEMRFHWQIE